MRDGQGFGRFILVTNTDITLRELAPNLAPLTIGWMLGPVAAGLFSLAQRATALLQQPAILLSQASYAVLADLVAKRNLAQLRSTVWRSAALAGTIAAPIVLAFWLAGDHLLPLVGGKTFKGGVAIVTLLAGARLAALIASPITAGLTALGKPQRSMMATLITNLAFYPLLPVLIWALGLHGAGLHALIQNVIATGMLILFFTRDARDPATPAS
jgi:O-antigen/teichoic acid export membrane protein